jgi:hypothetical protein
VRSEATNQQKDSFSPSLQSGVVSLLALAYFGTSFLLILVAFKSLFPDFTRSHSALLNISLR